MQGQQTENEVEKVEEYLFKMHSPKAYDGPQGLEVSMKKQFTETCILLAQYVSTDPRKMSVVEFYTALETVKKQLKAKKK